MTRPGPVTAGLASGVHPGLVADMVGWRRHLHERPELSSQEFETTDFIAGLLESWGLAVERALPTGAVARVGDGARGPTLALRADIDALPVAERSGVPFASRTPGRMHACGHDGHTAMLLAAARVLAAAAGDLDGEVRLVFQPAEETIDGGMQPLVDAGALDGVDAAVALHLWSELPTGTIAVEPGAVLASMDEFRIVVRGAGGHGAQPHRGRDALVAAASLVGALQTIVSRRVDPLEPAVVTVGTFASGTAFNVLADEARLTGTARALSEEVRGLLDAEIARVATACAAASGAEADVEYRRGAPVLVNHPRMVELVAAEAARVVGPDGLSPMRPMMGGDDFAVLAGVVPAAYAFVGAGGDAPGLPHHHPGFAIDEAALEIGLRVLLGTADRFLAGASAPGG